MGTNAASTGYQPPTGEYIRPAGFVHLAPGDNVDNHFVRGTWYHQASLNRFRDGQRLDFELVPEPGNPWDHWSVAVHARGARIGYVAAEDSGRWHDVVTAYNRRGQAVHAGGLIRKHGDVLAATVLLPMFDRSEELMDELGLFEECRRVTDDLPEEARSRILPAPFYLEDADIELIRARAHLAPSLNWQIGTGDFAEDRYPVALLRYFIRRDKEERAQRRAAREAATAARRAAKEAERRRKEAEREAFAADAVRMFRLGHPRSAIARKHGCSLGRVNLALTAAGELAASRTGPGKSTAAARDERLEKARKALELQRAGLLRREIAERLECVPETVKILLRDAKFYEDPAANPGRLETLLRANALKDETRDRLAAELGVNLVAVKEIRRDLGVIAKLHPGLLA